MGSQQHTSGQQGHITYTTWRAVSHSLTDCRVRMDQDACVVLGKRKQSRQVRGAHASIAVQHHTRGQQGHITHTTWRAASHSLTSCRIRRDPDACVVLGNRKQFRVVRGAHASMASQQHTSEQRGHTKCDTSRAAKPTAHQLQNQDESRCMCEVVERKQSKLVRGAHASMRSQQHTSGQQGHITYTT